jgi:tetratricopeptide (TPR) repeat protein
MPLMGVVADRCQRIALMWQWRFWQQVGSPARTVAALNHLLADWDACVTAAEAVSTKPCHVVTPYRSSRSDEGATPPLHLLATRAHALGQLERWCDARAQLEQLRALQPTHAAHAFNLGYVCAQLGDAPAATQAFQACIQVAPHIDRAWYGLGAALFDQGDWSGAEAAWVKQVNMQPLCPDGYTQLVRLAVQRQDAIAARSWLDQLRRFEPRQALALEPLVAAVPELGLSPLADCPA